MNSARSPNQYYGQTEYLCSMITTKMTSRNEVFKILTSSVSMDEDIKGGGSFLARLGWDDSARFSSIRRRLATLCSF